jgi:hypothetical protein
MTGYVLVAAVGSLGYVFLRYIFDTNWKTKYTNSASDFPAFIPDPSEINLGLWKSKEDDYETFRGWFDRISIEKKLEFLQFFRELEVRRTRVVVVVSVVAGFVAGIAFFAWWAGDRLLPY